VIPCRDYGQYLNDAIESVLRQDDLDSDAEIIIVDDYSSDAATLGQFSYWKSANPRVQVIHNTGTSGTASARNLGIARASGEWIAFLDADDVWIPGSLQTRWRVVQTCPDAQWLGADFKRWHENGSIDPQGFFETQSLTRQLLHNAYESGAVVRLPKPVREFLQVSLGWTSTVIAKRSLLLQAGGFEPTLGNYEDHHLWIRLARLADFYFVPQVVALYRQHAISVSRRDVPPASWYIGAMGMLWRDPDFRAHRPLIRKKLASLFEQNMYYHRARGETKLAVTAAAHALFHGLSCRRHWRNLVASVARYE
jgi:glycosyltransferase involved in cell wall biosynthesis